MTLRDRIAEAVTKTVKNLWPQVQEKDLDKFVIERPKEASFGDFSSNAAFRLSMLFQKETLLQGKSVSSIAQNLQENIPKIPGIAKVEVAGQGFLNFFIDSRWLQRQVSVILAKRQVYGKTDIGKGERVLLEFISANPTGPLTLANGRGGFYGDVLANVFGLAGFRPWREYYVNDQGNQVNILAESVLRRYWQAQGIRIDYPDYCYQGEYVRELAKSLYLPNYKLGSMEKLEVVRDKIKGRIVEKMLRDIKRVIRARMKITFDRFFSEKTLYSRGEVDRVLVLLAEKGVTYEKDGALWMKTTAFGDDKDRVLMKSDGEPTYFLSDIALRNERFSKRKFSREILIVGADHHGYVKRMAAAVAAIGFPGRLLVRLIQFVRLFQDGQEVRMSKRRGTYVTIDDLLEEVDADAARFFFLLHAADTHMDFDLTLAKERSEKNPVYYVQYAHARISSILRKAGTLARSRVGSPTKKTATTRQLANSPTRHPAESALVKQLVRWPEVVEDTARDHSVHRLPTYSLELARTFHDFYDRVRVIDGERVDPRRLALIRATQIVLANILKTMGISAPKKM